MGLDEDLLAGFSHALGVSADETLRSYVREGKGRLQGNAKLLAWDANSIHSFVFDTSNATGIRGASDMLRAIDDGLRDGLSLGLQRGQVLFAGGGSGLAVVPAAQVDSCMRTLHRIFAEQTRIATCTAASVLLEPDREFPELVKAIRRELARERIRTDPDAEPAVPFFVERCDVCGRRAAAENPSRGPDRRSRLECRPCYERIERGKRKVHFEKEPSGFEDIADDGGKGFYAAVYLDGNGIGKAITQLQSPLAYASFSKAIDDVLGDSFAEVAGQYGLREEGYQRPICGGDDVVAILPGQLAVPFTRDLLSTIERAADAHPALGGSKIEIGASAGVAIGHVKFPIRHLLAEAGALLRAAKRRRYSDTAARSALSFTVVTDGSPRTEAEDPPRLASKEGKRPGEEGLLLSGRPYTLQEFELFSARLRTIRAADRVGRTQLYGLKSHAARGPRQLRNHVLYQLGRREEWRDLAVALGGGDASRLADPDACMDQFVPEYGGRRVFDVADMIDLLGHWAEPEP